MDKVTSARMEKSFAGQKKERGACAGAPGFS